jgi:1-deoxy-D-xylulose-5-phosphate reductoisomerase
VSDAPRRLAIIGSTGSIGRNALDVVRQQRARYEVVALAAHSNAAVLLEQVREFAPREIGIIDPAAAATLRAALPGRALQVGPAAVAALAGAGDTDTVLVSVSGVAGLAPALAAVRAGKRLALATKEVLVAAGALVLDEARRHHAEILPVDSEHSAIFQCMQAAGTHGGGSVERLILTASGGPFRTRTRAELGQVTAREALAHPTWRMGSKISIDSATLMNKGLEVIEAHWLFGIPAARIAVVIHPQSVVHSLVEFCDGSMVAQLSSPDMRTPILYALSYPARQALRVPRLDLVQVRELTFFEPNHVVFPCLDLAYEALQRGGTAPAVLNAANEVAVQRFLRDEIAFLDIPRTVEKALLAHTVVAAPTLEDILAADAWARGVATAFTVAQPQTENRKPKTI